MYTYSMSFCITNANTPYLHVHMYIVTVCCVFIDSNRDTEIHVSHCQSHPGTWQLP